MAECFDHGKLRSEIVAKWGPAGAHIEVFDAMERRIAELENRLAQSCSRCAMVIPHDAKQCPRCGSTDTVSKSEVKCQQLSAKVAKLEAEKAAWLRERAELLGDVERLETERDAWRQLAMRLRPSVMFNVTEEQG